MATQLQLRKGTKIQNDAFTGAEAEITYDSTSKGLRLHDGVKQGGYVIDVVVDWQAPTAENNYTWYRKYSSGWVEQGGFATSQDSAVSLPITMANANYNIFGLAITSGKDNNTRYPAQVYSQSTTGFSLFINVGTFVKASWRAEGMAA